MRRLTFAFLALAVMAGCAVDVQGRAGHAHGPPPSEGPPPDRTVQAPPPPPSSPAPTTWESRGWTLLGEKSIASNKTAARIMLPEPQNQPTLSKIAVVVSGGEMRMHTAMLMYRNRVNSSVSIDKVFKDGDSHEVDLRASAGRPLWYFEFQYPTASVKGNPRVQIWGFAK